jgi:monovalent cation/hydrogen antiporter
MQGSSVHAVELVFLLLLLFVVVFASLARKLQLPYPVALPRCPSRARNR